VFNSKFRHLKSATTVILTVSDNQKMEKINWKIIRKILVFGIVIFFIGKRFYNSAERNAIKSINEIYYSGDYETAKNQLKLHLNKYPKSSNAWSYLGLVNLELNDTINAKINYQKGFELDNNNYKAITGLGIIARMNGNYESAQKYYEKSIAIKPNNPDAYSSLLVLEIINGNYQKAVELGEKAKSMQNIRLGVLGNLSIAYHYNKQFKKRDKILKELENKKYKDIEYIKMVINGEIDIKSIL